MKNIDQEKMSKYADEILEAIDQYRKSNPNELVNAQCDSMTFLIRSFKINLTLINAKEHFQIEPNEVFGHLVNRYGALIRTFPPVENKVTEFDIASDPIHAIYDVMYSLFPTENI